MRAWSSPDVPSLPVPGPVVRVHDTASNALVETRPEGPARMYVCGITPYDATHMGHAATYVGFDLLNRAWRNAGHDVTYVQNVTDVDDPLLERAEKVKVDWVELAERETQLFRDDMEALRVLPPAHYTGAVESIPQVIALIERLDEAGAVYRVEDDLYFSVTADEAFGDVSGLDRETMLEIFPERGGDPDREGKKDPLDCLLWRAERPGEPSWPSPWGPGRPGWHIECSALALRELGTTIDLHGGGSDLIFPHHECEAAQSEAATGEPLVRHWMHQAMVRMDGEKMSKSLGNLVFVSDLSQVWDPRSIRLACLVHHYRDSWEWRDSLMPEAQERLTAWVAAGAGDGALEQVRAALDEDLDTPAAIEAIDAAVARGEGVDRAAMLLGVELREPVGVRP